MLIIKKELNLDIYEKTLLKKEVEK